MTIKVPDKRLYLITGNYGSGKTEFSVNFIKQLSGIRTLSPTIVDMDIVNPYFRSREALKLLEGMGVEVVAPRGEHALIAASPNASFPFINCLGIKKPLIFKKVKHGSVHLNFYGNVRT